jgi:hypothetical protein
MADTAEKTAGGATRSLLGSLGFIFLMVAIEGVTSVAPLQLGVAVLLFPMGALCLYAAFFWESAKGVLSDSAQRAIGSFAQHRVVKFGMLALVLQTLVLSRFVEEHRWPFSYPADPKISDENNSLKSQINTLRGDIGREKEAADKWRVTHALRSNQSCKFELHMGPKAGSVTDFWDELFRAGGWTGPSPLHLPSDAAMPLGVTMRVGKKDGYGASCADFAQTLFNQYYGNPPTKVFYDQQSPYLSSCGDNCVQVEINY